MYSINYDQLTGLPISIQFGTTSMPINPANREFRRFLEWNAQQPVPLDWHTGIGAHVPTATEIKYRQAVVTARAIPNWATWTQADWDTFFNANLSTTQVNAASTTAQIRGMLNKQNLVIQNLVKLVIAMRDQTWPDL